MKYIIKALRFLADKLENFKCAVHRNWNMFLESLKSKCVCEKLTK